MISNSMLRSFWLRLPALLARLALLLAFGLVGASAGAQTTVTFFHNDILGSPTIATGADGTVVWKENYLPYGHRQAAPAAGANNKLWFAGKPFDPDIGLSYMGARYYIPLVGRFTGVDPQGIVPEDPHSFNRYAYANNNPYKYVDPDGKSPVVAYRVGVTLLALAGAANHLTPERRAQMTQAGALLQQRTSELLDRASGLVFNEGGSDGKDRESTLRPGPNAGESIPARGPGRDFTPEEREKINEIGRDTGCHTCGKTDPGTKSGNFVPDHQPANGLNPDGGPQRLYPHCLSCSRTQGGQVRGAGNSN